jgi:hypothetical protein
MFIVFLEYPEAENTSFHKWTLCLGIHAVLRIYIIIETNETPVSLPIPDVAGDGREIRIPQAITCETRIIWFCQCSLFPPPSVVVVVHQRCGGSGDCGWTSSVTRATR